MTTMIDCLKTALVVAATMFTVLTIATYTHNRDMKRLKERREREEKHRAEMAGKTINIIQYKPKRNRK